MSSLTEYFEKTAYQPKYQIGDRVFGHYNKIPFIGTVGNDRDKVGTDGPEVTIMLDLPMQYQGEIKNMVVVKHKDIKPVVEF